MSPTSYQLLYPAISAKGIIPQPGLFVNTRQEKSFRVYLLHKERTAAAYRSGSG